MGRLILAVSTCVVLTYAAFVATIFMEYPTAVVCERGRTADVRVSSTRIHGFFDERRVGPCVAFFHHNRGPGGGIPGGD